MMKSFSLVLLCLFSFCANAQKGNWAMELSGGLTVYQGDVSKEGFGTAKGKEGAWGIKTCYDFSDYWALEASFHKGKTGAADSFFVNDEFRALRQYQFETKFKDIAIKARFSPLKQLRLQPHTSLGLGMVFFDPNAFMLNNLHQDLTDLVKQDLETVLPTRAWFIPLEFGLRFAVNDRVRATAGLQLNFTFTDYLDGIHWAGNPNDKDRYGQLFMGAQFIFNGIKDIDGDGIPDIEDECPFKPGRRATHGCPDADNDNIKDSKDRCPYAAGTTATLGCPDTDKDGTPDPFDRCPTKAGPPEALGCPSIDTDHDGIEDHLDDCPLDYGAPERNGCPSIDTDLDGILDEDDRCPQLYGLPIFLGCPDTDGDGIEDANDACPSVFGFFAEQGCPQFANIQEEVTILSQQKLRFAANSTTINNYILLDKIINFLKENPSYQLTINGYADPLGSDETTDYISQLRAEKVKQYFESQSIDSQRLSVKGLGVLQTISNKPGLLNQAKNRRVEFVLF